MAAEHIRHWRVGDVEIARIVEVNGWEDDITMLLPDATPQYVQQFGWLQPYFATPEGKMIISFQCFVLRSKGRSVMIDTCIGADRKTWQRPAFRMNPSPTCCARTCTSTMWAGTRAR
jgi:hypothetical protein